jgi:hypothetical protein
MTFQAFFEAAQREALKIVGSRANLSNHAIMIAMMRLMHDRMVAVESVAEHARPDAAGRRED